MGYNKQIDYCRAKSIVFDRFFMPKSGMLIHISTEYIINDY